MGEPILPTEPDSMETQLASHLYRYDCPKAIELGEYCLNLLGGSRYAYVAGHLPTCPRCAAEVSGYRTFLEQPGAGNTATSRLRGRVGWLIAALLPDLSSSQHNLVPAYRGAGGHVRNYQADGYEINLEVQQDGDHPGQKLVVGLVLGGVTPGMEAWLQLSADAPAVARAEVDEFGSFVLQDVMPGVYDLLISDVDQTVNIRIPEFDAYS